MSKTITIGESSTASTLTVGSTGTTTTTLKGTTVNVIGTFTGITSSGNITATTGSLVGTSVVAPTYGPSADETDVSFCPSSTGTINIGTGTRTATKAINIGTGVGSTGAINIGVKDDIATTGTPLTLNGSTIAIEPEKTKVMNIATAQTTGILNIGTGVRTTGAINIGTGAGSTNAINIGATGTTTINGTLNTSLGTIAGKLSFISYDVQTLGAPTTLDMTTVNLDLCVVFFNTGPAGSLSIPYPTIPNNQKIIFKNWCTDATTVTISFTSTTYTTAHLYLYGTSNANAAVSSISLPQGDSIVIEKQNNRLYQITPNRSFPLGLTSTNLEPTSSSSALALGATQTTGILNIGTGARTSGAINIGTTASSTTPINIGGVNSSATNATSLSSSTISLNGGNIWSNSNTLTSFRSGVDINLATYVGVDGTINIGNEVGTSTTVNIGIGGSGKYINFGGNTTNIQTVNTTIGSTTTSISGKLGIGITTPSAPLHIYEATGPDTPNSTNGGTAASIILEHGNAGGTSAIVFKSKNNPNSDYGYMYYVDDITNSTNERSALCVGVENDKGDANVNPNDVLVLNRNGCYVGIGKTNPTTLLDVNGAITSTSLDVNGAITSTSLIVNGPITTTSLIVNGTITQSTWAPKQIIQAFAYSSSLGDSINTIVSNNNTYSDTTNLIFEFTITPKSTNSIIYTNFDCYYTINGSGEDIIDTRIFVTGSTNATIAQKKYNMPATIGTSFGRNGCILFPLSGAYKNSSLSMINVKIQCRRAALPSDDTTVIDNNTWSCYVQEIQR